MFPDLTQFTDYSLVFLRFMVDLVFVSSGYSHLKNPTEKNLRLENVLWGRRGPRMELRAYYVFHAVRYSVHRRRAVSRAPLKLGQGHYEGETFGNFFAFLSA